MADQMEKQTCREKHWSEISSDQKIERMRLEVKRMQRLIDELRDNYAQMASHVHVGPAIAYLSSGPGGHSGRRIDDHNLDQYF